MCLLQDKRPDHLILQHCAELRGAIILDFTQEVLKPIQVFDMVPGAVNVAVEEPHGHSIGVQDQYNLYEAPQCLVQDRPFVAHTHQSAVIWAKLFRRPEDSIGCLTT